MCPREPTVLNYHGKLSLVAVIAVLNPQYSIPRYQYLSLSAQSPENVGKTLTDSVYTYSAYRVISTKGFEGPPLSDVTERMPSRVQKDAPMWYAAFICQDALSPGATWQKLESLGTLSLG